MSEQKKVVVDEEKKLDEAEVHSANSWETADLGGDDRKQKFLRLMGASKKQHKGRIVIGDHDPVHVRSTNDVAKISDDLEDQYEQGMEHRRLGGRRGHRGLGFHEGEPTAENNDTQVKDAETGEEEKTEKKEENESESEKRKHSDDEKPDENPDDNPDDNPDESPTKKMKLSFVKAS